jgi:hypothetical protein
MRFTCGVTFVDRSHAITAGHCIDAPSVPTPDTTFAVEFYDADAALDWRTASALSGRFPAWTHPALDATKYSVTSTSCKVVRRCGFGDLACPDGARGVEGVDLALLECGELPQDRDPIAVADTDAETGPVTMFWFHEVYAVPATRAGTDDDLDRFDHYVAFSEEAQNFHYFGGGRNQLLPLVSKDVRAGGTARGRIARAGSIVWTDLAGCHGSSGSAVLQYNAVRDRYEVLGPTSTGQLQTRLCNDPSSVPPGTQNISYTALEFTRLFLAAP